jgi:hypothetical protein
MTAAISPVAPIASRREQNVLILDRERQLGDLLTMWFEC